MENVQNMARKTVHRAIGASGVVAPTSVPLTPRLDDRHAGVLMHLSSLPGPYGSGRLGADARAFADFLQAAGQRWWQMLPINPPGAPPGYSPYSSDSAFAANLGLIDLHGLLEDGLLAGDELVDSSAAATGSNIFPSPGTPACGERGRTGEGQGGGFLPNYSRASINPEVADFDHAMAFSESRLRLAYERFAGRNGQTRQSFERFLADESYWINDYSLFAAIKKASGGAAWCAWNRDLRLREPLALRHAAAELATEIEFQRFVQFQFDRQWRAFKEYCNARGIGLIGDIPIFVGHDSADVWANQHLFSLDASGNPTCVSGYPPDLFNADGQKWGHPHFNWDRHKADGYIWWLKRFGLMAARFDALRIDHFPGFDQYWAIAPDSPTAMEGKWMPGGGADFFRALRKEFGQTQIIAEDLGELTPTAKKLRDQNSFSGMRILQFAFQDDPYHRPHLYPKRCVAYTGTHDNETFVGWYEKLKIAARRNKSARQELGRAKAYLGLGSSRHAHLSAIRALYASAANTVIIPMQDLLGLDTKSRMNIPGTCQGNWTWRLSDPAYHESAKRLRELTAVFGRE